MEKEEIYKARAVHSNHLIVNIYARNQAYVGQMMLIQEQLLPKLKHYDAQTIQTIKEASQLRQLLLSLSQTHSVAMIMTTVDHFDKFIGFLLGQFGIHPAILYL